MNAVDTLKDLHILITGICDDATRLAHNAGVVKGAIKKALADMNTETPEI